jgi:hypothetical protein
MILPNSVQVSPDAIGQPPNDGTALDKRCGSFTFDAKANKRLARKLLTHVPDGFPGKVASGDAARVNNSTPTIIRITLTCNRLPGLSTGSTRRDENARPIIGSIKPSSLHQAASGRELQSGNLALPPAVA